MIVCVHLCVCVCACVCVYLCDYVCMSIFVFLCVFTCVRVCVYDRGCVLKCAGGIVFCVDLWRLINDCLICECI